MFACLTLFVLSLYLAVQFIFAVGSNSSVAVSRIEDRWVEYWGKIKKKFKKKEGEEDDEEEEELFHQSGI